MAERDPVVVLFAYARPSTLAQTLASLRANRVPRLLAFSDAAKDASRADQVKEVRRMLHAVEWCDVRVVERPANLGLGASVRAGCAEALAEHGSIIVCEDDLVLAPGAYTWLSSALWHYEDDARVMSVTGWTHRLVTPAGIEGAPYFDGRAECQLWGTWRNRWSGMDRSATELVRDCEARGIDVYKYGADLPALAREEASRNVWAVRWLFLHMARRSLCLRPPRAMVQHIGVGPDASNVREEEWFAGEPARSCAAPAAWPEPAEHPDCARLWREQEGGKSRLGNLALRMRRAAGRRVSRLKRGLAR